MSLSKLQANWSSVSFLPTNPSASSIPFDGVTNVKIDLGGDVMTFKADADIFDIMCASLTRKPTCSIALADYYAMMSLISGVIGTLAATHNDARLATGGAIVYTITSAVFENCSASGDHAAWGAGAANFKTVTTDGMTPPVGLARA
jgi:hypothetical protein